MNNSYNHSLSANSKLTQISANRCFDGEQHYYSHQSSATKTQMTFSIYLPDEALAGHRCPAVLYLSGPLATPITSHIKRIFKKNAASLA